MKSEYGILDLFAGPGGLGEGFAGYKTSDGSRPFRIQLSAEYEPNAWRTLRLRAFARQFENSRPPGYSAIRSTNELPDWASSHPREWERAGEEAQQLKLGEPEAAVAVDNAIKAAKAQHGDRTIVIGGPPCQAYSLVGRSRNAGKKDYTLANDEKTFLFREYVRVLKKLRPAVFIMENVSGLLSAKLDSEPVFDLIRNELTRMDGRRDYELVALDPRPTNLCGKFGPADFLVKAEAHGVPQARHRLLLVGLRMDVAAELRSKEGVSLPRITRLPEISAGAMLDSLPRLRSGLSMREQDDDEWHKVMRTVMSNVCRALPKRSNKQKPVAEKARELRDLHRESGLLERSSRSLNIRMSAKVPKALRTFIERPDMRHLFGHETRSHMQEDLERYFFAAVHALVNQRSPVASEFPAELAPAHANWNSGSFADRFRVQVHDKPSSTITSHISKDGHFFIHPDALQCRSLTVREAARMQTFPDDYLFLGPRTAQYVQVGNAVPPYLARQVAAALYEALSTSCANKGTTKKPTAKNETI